MAGYTCFGEEMGESELFRKDQGRKMKKNEGGWYNSNKDSKDSHKESCYSLFI